MLLKSNPMEDQVTFVSLQVSTQDGGNSSDLMEPSLSTKKERSSMSKEVLMERIRTS
jgi:hypothetical protein